MPGPTNENTNFCHYPVKSERNAKYLAHLEKFYKHFGVQDCFLQIPKMHVFQGDDTCHSPIVQYKHHLQALTLDGQI